MDNLLFISNLFPNPLEPALATFNRQQIAALSMLFNIDVIAPIAWQRRFRKRNFVFRKKYARAQAYYPTYWNTPGILHYLNGPLFKFSVNKIVKKLSKEKKYTAIYSSWLFPDAWAAMKIAEKLAIPLFVKVHGSDVNGLSSESAITSMSLDVVKYAAKVFCVSNALKNCLVELGANEESLEVVYNGVNKKLFFRHVSLQKKDPKGKTILFVGNLKETKGLKELFFAFHCLFERTFDKDIRLVMIGDGPFRERFLGMVEEYKLASQVDMLGVLSPDQVACWMNMADVLCLPSYMEGVPNVVMEALSCNLHVVATDVGGIPELAQQCSGITLVKPRSADSLLVGLENALIEKEDVTLPNFISSWHDNAKVLFEIMSQE